MFILCPLNFGFLGRACDRKRKKLAFKLWFYSRRWMCFLVVGWREREKQRHREWYDLPKNWKQSFFLAQRKRKVIDVFNKSKDKNEFWPKTKTNFSNAVVYASVKISRNRQKNKHQGYFFRLFLSQFLC